MDRQNSSFVKPRGGKAGLQKNLKSFKKLYTGWFKIPEMIKEAPVALRNGSCTHIALGLSKSLNKFK